MRPILALILTSLLTLPASAFWGKKKAPELPAGTTDQLAAQPPQGQSPDRPAPAQGAEAAQPQRKRAWLAKAPGIFPVYEMGGRWVLLLRDKSLARGIGKGSEVVVIGSRGADRFVASASTRTAVAACEGHKPAPTDGFLLSPQGGGSFKKVGVPIVGILLRKGAAYDTSRAGFYVLNDEVAEATYARFDKTVRSGALDDLRSGGFAVDPADEDASRLAQRPDPDRVQTKFDFGSRIKHRSFKDPFLLVEGSQISKSYRRCLYLFDGDQPVGRCVEMPHALMAETRQLRFVAYDPGTGRPFILAYTEKDPLWGHERWGFQMTEESPRLFLMDALDPRCREGF